MTAADRQTALQICERIPVQFVLGDAQELGFGAGSRMEGEPGSPSNNRL
jgi:hypothetical protein